LQEQFHLLTFAWLQMEERLRRDKPFPSMKGHGINNRVRSAVVQVRPRIVEAPERRRAPFTLTGRSDGFSQRHGLGLISGSYFRGDHAVGPGITQFWSHIVQQKVAVNAIHAAEFLRMAGGTANFREKSASAIDV